MSWREYTGLSDEKTRVMIYPTKGQVEQWEEEIEEQPHSSRSAYLLELIQEARAYRQEGYLSHHDAEERISELQSEIDHLDAKLQRAQQQESGSIDITDQRFLERFLTDQYQPLGDILQRIIESGALEDLVRRRIEHELYALAQEDVVEYKTGHGWKLTDTGGDR